MTRPVASPNETATIAVVGAQSPAGTLLREALAASRVPGSRVNLYGTTDGEAVISEYAGEARLIQDPSLPEIAAHRFIYLCESGELARQVLGAARPESTVIDLVGCVPAELEPRLVHPEVRRESLAGRRGYVTVPHALALILTELLHGIEAAHGVEQAVATVLRPASDSGEPGVEELREQTVRLLNFAEVPSATFGAQLAFNILGSSAGEAAGAAERIGDEACELLGWDRQRLAVSCLTVPVFYGHSEAVHIETERKLSASQVCDILQNAPGIELFPSQDAKGYPTAVTESSGKDPVFTHGLEDASGAYH